MREKTVRSGFSLIELLIVIVIIGVLAAIIVLILDPLEIIRSSRDSIRLQDLATLRDALNANLTQNPRGLCNGSPPPCFDESDDPSPYVRRNDGTGWIKYDFNILVPPIVAVLPVDPTNNHAYHYSFYSDGEDFELNAVLESAKNKNKMFLDGGDNINIYEVGSNTTLMH